METEEKKFKINKKILFVVIAIILLVSFCIILIKTNNLKEVLTSNDSNMGLVVKGEDLTFFYNYNKGLVRKDNSSEKILTQNQTYSLNYFEGKLYYATPNSRGGIDIKSIDKDGKNEEKLLSITSSSTKIYLQGSNIYYLTSNPDTISKINIKNKDEEVVLQRTVVDFKVVEDTIYFSDIMGFLYKVDTNGKNYKTLIKKNLFSKFQILEDYVYYFDSENSKLMKISLKDFSKKEEVSDKLNCDIYNVTTNGVYYLDKKNNQICYVSLNGKKNKNIVKINTNNTKLNIIDKTLYYIDEEFDKTVTKSVEIN